MIIVLFLALDLSHAMLLVSLRELIFLFIVNSSELLKDLMGELFINILVAVRQYVNFI